MDLIAQGTIPDSLSGAASEVASRTAVRNLTEPELERYAKVVDVVFTAACVEPVIGRDVEVGAVPFVWKVKVFNWCNLSVGALRPFRGESPGTVETA
jgi:hypothetical protein